MTGKVGPKGQVVIPKRIRDRLGIRPGDEVAFIEAHDEVRVKPRGVISLKGALAGEPLLEDLEHEHSLEIEKDGATGP